MKLPARLLILLAPLSLGAQAHTGHAAMDSLAQAMAHPFLGLDHVMALLAVGLWSSASSTRRWRAPAVFLAGLALGTVLGLRGLPASEALIAASLVVLGLLLVRRTVSEALALSLMGLFALCHGLAHGAELASASALTALVGLGLGSAALQGLGLASGLWLQKVWPQGLRWLGAFTGLVGGALWLGLA